MWLPDYCILGANSLDVVTQERRKPLSAAAAFRAQYSQPGMSINGEGVTPRQHKVYSAYADHKPSQSLTKYLTVPV